MRVQTMSLEEDNYDVTEGECPDCEDGSLWVNSFELVCDECGGVYRKAQKHSDDSSQDESIMSDPFIEFNSNREKHRYDNSGRVRMPGGFEEAYEGDGLYGNGHDEDEIADYRRRY